MNPKKPRLRFPAELTTKSSYLVIAAILSSTSCSNPKEIIDRKSQSVSLLSNDGTKSGEIFDPNDKYPPDPPTNIMVKSVGPYSLLLSWTASLDQGQGGRIKSYRIFRNSEPVAEVNGTTLSYEDSGLSEKTEYKLSISSIDIGNNESVQSEPVLGTTDVVSGLSLFVAYCESCHGDMATTDKKNRSAEDISNAINAVPSMKALKDLLDQTKIKLIAEVLSTESKELKDPTPPANFRAQTTLPTAAVMTWDAKQNKNGMFTLRGYKIYRDGQLLATKSQEELLHEDLGLTSGNTYAYQVSAFYENGKESLTSQAISITPNVASTKGQTAPTPPKALEGKVLSATSIELKWEQEASPEPILGYHIYVNDARMTSVPPTLRSKILYNVPQNSTHNVTLTAFAADGTESSKLTPLSLLTPVANGSELYTAHCVSCHVAQSKADRSASAIAAAIQIIASMNPLSILGDDDLGAISLYLTTKPDISPPSIPTGLILSQFTSQSITLNWSASTDSGGSGLRGYKVFRNGNQISIVNAQTTSFVDQGLASNSNYTYFVRAIDYFQNESQPSVSISGKTAEIVTVDSQKPSIPMGLLAQNIASKSFTLQWNASQDQGGSGLREYRIFSNDSLIGSVGAGMTSYTFSGLEPQTQYQLQVSARDNAGNESDRSSPLIIRTAPPPTGAQLYAENCASCHQPLLNSTKKNRSIVQLNSAISTVQVMKSLSFLTSAERLLIIEALSTQLNSSQGNLFVYQLPYGTRTHVSSRLSRVFLNPQVQDPTSASTIKTSIDGKNRLFGGPCNHYDRTCPTGVAVSQESTESTMTPDPNVSRIGYRFKACGMLTSSDLAINSALINAGILNTDPISDAAIDKIYRGFYPGKILNADAKVALTNLHQRTRQLATTNQNLQAWGMVLYSLCTSIEFDTF